MITAEDFRRIACGMPGSEEKGHMGHPDFRVAGKIFATLGYPDEGWGMVKLTPEDQRTYVAQDDTVFVPVKGAWGLRGCTNVRLRDASEAVVNEALETAWRTVQAKNKPGPKKHLKNR